MKLTLSIYNIYIYIYIIGERASAEVAEFKVNLSMQQVI
jgi:hypothetical protein